MGFCGRAAAHKPKITMRNANWTNLGFADARRTFSPRTRSANYNVWWRRDNGLGLFFMVQARPLSFSEGKS